MKWLRLMNVFWISAMLFHRLDSQRTKRKQFTLRVRQLSDLPRTICTLGSKVFSPPLEQFFHELPTANRHSVAKVSHPASHQIRSTQPTFTLSNSLSFIIIHSAPFLRRGPLFKEPTTIERSSGP
jgi:hypothetical protein